MSLPKQIQDHGALDAAYRFLSNSRVQHDDIAQPHRTRTRQACEGRGVVLCVQDSTELDFTTRIATQGLGPIGNGSGTGMLLHNALAVSLEGELLGVLDQHFVVRGELRGEESSAERAARWRESDLWGDTVERIGAPPTGCRFVSISDRASDCMETMERCDAAGAGFVVRAGRKRNVEGGTDKLWPWAAALPSCGTTSVHVTRQAAASRRHGKEARKAEVSIRFGQVTLDPPWRSDHASRQVWVVYAREDQPPAPAKPAPPATDTSAIGRRKAKLATPPIVEPVEWLLLCSEPVKNEADARRMLDWYTRRWIIEEWHRALKEGCRAEDSQLDHADDIKRLVVMQSVVACWLVQMRDMAEAVRETDERADDPKVLQAMMPGQWVKVVAMYLKKKRADQLTPREFWSAIARKGGWLGRKSDMRPGWKVIWRGWTDFSQWVEFADLAESNGFFGPSSCAER